METAIQKEAHQRDWNVIVVGVYVVSHLTKGSNLFSHRNPIAPFVALI